MVANELKSMLHLLEDPDESIFEIIRPKIIAHAEAALPFLLELESYTLDEDYRQRIQILIADINFELHHLAILKWMNQDEPSYLELILQLHTICPLGHTDEEAKDYLQFLRKKIWLECNNYLTTLELAQVFIKVLFENQLIRDINIAKITPSYHALFLGSIMNAQNGHNILLALLHKGLAQLFEIPMQLIQTNDGRLLCAYIMDNGITPIQTLCYIDPGYGSAYSQADLVDQINILSHKDVVLIYFQQLHSLATKDKQQYLQLLAQQILQKINDE